MSGSPAVSTCELEVAPGAPPQRREAPVRSAADQELVVEPGELLALNVVAVALLPARVVEGLGVGEPHDRAACPRSREARGTRSRSRAGRRAGAPRSRPARAAGGGGERAGLDPRPRAPRARPRSSAVLHRRQLVRLEEPALGRLQPARPLADRAGMPAVGSPAPASSARGGKSRRPSSSRRTAQGAARPGRRRSRSGGRAAAAAPSAKGAWPGSCAASRPGSCRARTRPRRLPAAGSRCAGSSAPSARASRSSTPWPRRGSARPAGTAPGRRSRTPSGARPIAPGPFPTRRAVDVEQVAVVGADVHDEARAGATASRSVRRKWKTPASRLRARPRAAIQKAGHCSRRSRSDTRGGCGAAGAGASARTAPSNASPACARLRAAYRTAAPTRRAPSRHRVRADERLHDRERLHVRERTRRRRRAGTRARRAAPSRSARGCFAVVSTDRCRWRVLVAPAAEHGRRGAG